jgi:hypothetical protein
MKAIFDRREKQRNFILGDLVVRWDSRREDPGKHGNFDHLWLGPYKIVVVEGNNLFSLQNLEGYLLEFLMNGRFLKLVNSSFIVYNRFCLVLFLFCLYMISKINVFK